MNSPLFVAVANHLWLSTLFAAAVGALTLLFRRNRASLRHALWLTASLKFLVPFSLLTALGARFPLSAFWQSGRHGGGDVAASPGITPPWLTVLDDVATPVAPSHTAAVNVVAPHANAASIDIGTVIGAVWILGALAVLAFWYVRWINVRRALRSAAPIDLPFCVPVKCGDSLLEPGIVGIFRPVLFLPKGIEQRLTPSQLQAVLAHEQCHVQRRDNLMAALHMIVEAAFWFHPLVWWIGARLVAERERACDEHVLRAGHASNAYAEGILNVCQHYLESKLPIVSGVSGADLRQRIERVMSNMPVVAIGSAKKSLLALASCAVLAVPIAIGCFTSGSVYAQSRLKAAATADPYETILIRETPAGTNSSSLMAYSIFSDSLEISNRTLRQLIAYAYRVDETRVSGGPEWLGTTHYDIRTAAPAQLEKSVSLVTAEEVDAHRLKIQALLASRFGLVVKHSTSTRAALALTVAEGGSRLEEAKSSVDGYIEYLPNGIHSRGLPLPWLAEQLAGHLGASVTDETGLEGLYAVNLAWGPESGFRAPPPLPVPLSPSVLESALHDQLGLTLVSRTLPLESIVVEAAQPLQNAGAPPASASAFVYQSISLRLSARDAKGMAIGYEPPSNSFVMKNGTLRHLVASAYHVDNRRITGGAWLDEPKIDLYIKGIPGWANSSNNDRHIDDIIRNVLEQKFGIVVDRGGLQVDGYALEVAPGGFKAPATSPNAHSGMRGGKNSLDIIGYTLDMFALSAGGFASGPVVNETGLSGTYDFHLSWGPNLPFTDPTPAVQLTPEKWREVLRDQIGLILEPRKMSAEQLEVVSVKPVIEVLPLTM